MKKIIMLLFVSMLVINPVLAKGFNSKNSSNVINREQVTQNRNNAVDRQNKGIQNSELNTQKRYRNRGTQDSELNTQDNLGSKNPHHHKHTRNKGTSNPHHIYRSK